MDKNALKELIKKLVREKVGTMNIPREEPVKYTDKFLSFEEVLTELLTDQYSLFIQDVGWVAPKPTTFRVEFKNGQSTYLTKTEKGWNCEVEGKKYDLEVAGVHKHICDDFYPRGKKYILIPKG